MDIDDIKALAWPGDREKALRLQELLCKKKRIIPLSREPRLVAGVDSAFSDDRIISAACLYTYPGIEPVAEAHAVRKAAFPYIPGLLSFREGPAVMEAVEALPRRPDVLLCDGQGIAHPRGLGLASFAGVLLGLPSIGCAKSRLVGEYDEPGARKGSRAALVYRGQAVGVVLRTRDNVKPVFVSPGHLIDIEGSVEIVMGCVGRYRLPEPLRAADILSRALRKSKP